MGIVILEVCDSNPAASLQLESLEEEFPGTSVIRSYCLSECDLCAQNPYVMINGTILIGESLDTFMEQIRAQIQVELDEWA